MTSGIPPGPRDAQAVGTALHWVEGALTGPVATAAAVLAVAAIGFLMLSGRIDFSKAGRVALGCFVILGASSIAAGIGQAGRPSNGTAPSNTDSPPPPPMPAPYPQASTAPYDPYAGAALPAR
jgi:type IV secretory pathway VirB2 component (pilin)